MQNHEARIFEANDNFTNVSLVILVATDCLFKMQVIMQGMLINRRLIFMQEC